MPVATTPIRSLSQPRRHAGRRPALARPVSETLRGDLRQAILAGDLAPGSRLPSCRDLGRRYGVAFGVANVALDALVAEGLLVKRPGTGVYVRDSYQPRHSVVRVWTQYPASHGLSQALARFGGHRAHWRVETAATPAEADLWITGALYAWQAWGDGRVLALHDHLEALDVTRDDFWPEALQGCTVGRQLFALPVIWSPQALVYNRELLGRTRPESWDFTALLAWVRGPGARLAARDIRPFSCFRSFQAQVLPVLVRMGGRVLGHGGTRCLLASATCRRAFAYCRDLAAAMPGFPLRTRSSLEDLQAGRLAVRLGDPNMLVGAAGQPPGYGVAPLPVDAGAETRFAGAWLQLPAHAANADGAVALARSLLAADTQDALAAAGYLFPGRRTAIERRLAATPRQHGLERLLDFVYDHPHLRADDLAFVDLCLDGFWTCPDLPALLAETAAKLEARLATSFPQAAELEHV